MIHDNAILSGKDVPSKPKPKTLLRLSAEKGSEVKLPLKGLEIGSEVEVSVKGKLTRLSMDNYEHCIELDVSEVGEVE